MNKLKKINWIIIGLLLLTNIIFYPLLPEKIAIQFSLTGGVNRYAPKELGLLLLPAILAFVNYAQSGDDSKTSRMLVVNVLAFILNIGVNIVNLTIL
jgi:uncharacterized membrane protein